MQVYFTSVSCLRFPCSFANKGLLTFVSYSNLKSITCLYVHTHKSFSQDVTRRIKDFTEKVVPYHDDGVDGIRPTFLVSIQETMGNRNPSLERICQCRDGICEERRTAFSNLCLCVYVPSSFPNCTSSKLDPQLSIQNANISGELFFWLLLACSCMCNIEKYTLPRLIQCLPRNDRYIAETKFFILVHYAKTKVVFKSNTRVAIYYSIGVCISSSFHFRNLNYTLLRPYFPIYILSLLYKPLTIGIWKSYETILCVFFAFCIEKIDLTPKTNLWRKNKF